MNTSSTRRRLRAAAALTLSSALLLSACGSNDESDAAGTVSTAQPSASPSASATPSADASATADPGLTGTDLDPTLVDSGDSLGTTPQEEVFSVESPWNTRVTGERVAANSASLLQQSKFRTLVGLNGQTETDEVTEGVYVNTREWTVPVVAGGVPTVLTCRQIQCGDGDDDITLDVPTNVNPNPLYDGWFTIFDRDNNTAYDLWRARREDDGTISYHFMRTWALDGPGFSQPKVVGARGSGLPLFGGLIRPGELERCSINHALAISVPGPAAGYYIQPASSTDGNNKDDNSVPEGARLRLRADFQITAPRDQLTRETLPFNRDRRRYADCIVDALKTYGAIVVDRAAVPTLYFQRVEAQRGRRPLLNGYELNSIGLEDFQVIDFSGQERYLFPPEDDTIDPTSPLDFSGDDTTTTTGTSTTTTPAEGS